MNKDLEKRKSLAHKAEEKFVAWRSVQLQHGQVRDKTGSRCVERQVGRWGQVTQGLVTTGKKFASILTKGNGKSVTADCKQGNSKGLHHF